MIVLDTSLWVEHLRTGHQGVRDALLQGRVAAHPWVAGELALGGAGDEVLSLLDRLPQAVVAEPAEVRRLISTAGLTGTGIGWVDAQLLASARLTPGAQLATGDRKLSAEAHRLGVGAEL